MPVSSRGPGGVGPGGATRLSSPPSTRTPAKRAGSSDAARRHGLIWDHTVFHVVASCRANPAMVAPSKRNCRIAQRIARTPRRAWGAHTFLLWLQEYHRLAGAFAAYPASYCATGSLPGPGPRRVDDLHHHAPVALSDSPHILGSQHSGHRSLCRAPERIQAERKQPGGSPPSRRADHTDHNDQATQSSR